MKWFYKQLARKLKQASYGDSEIMKEGPLQPIRSIENEKTMNFSVTRASGGWVIEQRVYERKTDRNISSLHIITEDQDLGQELGKILMLTSMRS